MSVLLSCHLSGCFLVIASLDFTEFWHGARNPYEVVRGRARVFGKNFFASKIREMCQNLVINFHWICSKMKIYIICCVPAQFLYWEKSCSCDKGQNTLSQWDRRIYKSTLSPEQIEETVSFFCMLIQIHKN